LFKLTSLNLNGIRSATTKGWSLDRQAAPDCICVQEVKAQAGRCGGRFEHRGGPAGPFPLCREEGLLRRGGVHPQEPSDVIIGFGSPEFDAEGRYVELRFDTPAPAQALAHQRVLPQWLLGRRTPAGQVPLSGQFYPHLAALKAEREFILCGDVNIAHKEIDLKNWRSNQKNSGFLPEERAWMTKLLTEGGLVDVYRQLQPDATDTCLHLVEQPRPGLCQQRGLAAGLPPGHAGAGGTMVALAVKSADQVDALHAKALALGGTDEGAAGPRGATFYCGYVRDLDGNKLNLFCMTSGV
jgi:exodeoxyribonuclease-3